jgi:hypothetical protein
MAYKINPFTGKFDESSVNNVPIGSTTTYFNWVAPDTLQLIVNGSVAQQWVVSVSTSTGKPYGLLVSLTQP